MQFLASLGKHKIRASLNFLELQQRPSEFICRRIGEKRRRKGMREIQNTQTASIKEDKKLLRTASDYFVLLLLCLEH